MHKEVRYPSDDAPVYNPAVWRARNSCSSANIYPTTYPSENSSFLERLHETKRKQIYPNGASGQINQSSNATTADVGGVNNRHAMPMDTNGVDGNFVGLGAIGRAWASSYKVPVIETTEAELLAARAISAGEYRFVGRMILWAMWALLRSFILLILPASYKQAFLESSMFTWSVKKDDKNERKGSTSTPAAAAAAPSGPSDSRRGVDLRSISPSSRGSVAREDTSKPFVF